MGCARYGERKMIRKTLIWSTNSGYKLTIITGLNLNSNKLIPLNIYISSALNEFALQTRICVPRLEQQSLKSCHALPFEIIR